MQKEGSFLAPLNFQAGSLNPPQQQDPLSLLLLLPLLLLFRLTARMLPLPLNLLLLLPLLLLFRLTARTLLLPRRILLRARRPQSTSSNIMRTSIRQAV